MAKTTDKLSPADIITNTIIDKLESGVRPWVKPWRPGLGGRPLRATGDPYKGINCFWLWLCAEGAPPASRHPRRPVELSPRQRNIVQPLP
ncbi:ArdC family protein [Sphingomonas sp. CCH21-G11]|uniref:ArdC-like ssDNA-binding domain-containing protein n=1 Tax=Sphingomonas sp. CCH21-G11 TaxID=1768749 RepID=UPI00082FB523|nr:ArdC family protein [Sphingomonas sp. CCH21-G11]